MVEEAAEKKHAIHQPPASWDQFKDDYTQIPRGRVAWSIDRFIVLVRKWVEPIQEELAVLLEQEFSLPYFKFVFDEHWDLGHGWSGAIPTRRSGEKKE